MTERRERNGIVAIIQQGTNFVLWFEVNGRKIDRNHEEFEHYKSRYNAPEPSPDPRPGVEL